MARTIASGSSGACAEIPRTLALVTARNRVHVARSPKKMSATYLTRAGQRQRDQELTKVHGGQPHYQRRGIVRYRPVNPKFERGH